MTNFSTDEKTCLERSIDIKQNSISDLDLEISYELQKCVKWIKNNSYQRICLQFNDEGLIDACSVANYFKKTIDGHVFILADTTYAGCCVDSTAAKHVDADCLIHFGPACLSPHSGLPILHVFEYYSLDILTFVNSINKMTIRPTLLFYDTKYQNQITEIKNCLKNNSNLFICETAELSDDDHDVLFGRRIPRSSKYQQAIFLGSESMLLTNLTLLFPSLTWFLYDNEVIREFPLKTSKFLMKRLHLLEKLKDVAVVGILIGTLSVDGCLDAVQRIKHLCKLSGKKCYTVAVGRPNVAKLANLPEIEAFVLVACPENKLFIEYGDFYQPILSMIEVELALGSKTWSTEYSLDFRQLQPNGKLACDYSKEFLDKSTDVSLITGKVRHMDASTKTTDENAENSLLLKTPGDIVESRAAEFLSQRTWGGLEQKLGETSVEDALQGRKGIPMGYENEGCDK